ncbi:hypothetical protein HJG54_33010 [Leptolyngbya sp. NK1-12]|uniref:Fibronectin type-III domain-containing protein n=1 Tax=Leptolyngbya sp. NK1-12 TaxID=2547451 RepID=A0AA96WM90_9CYAN|nr:hypothetical protein [Leptolyngbya sp. NK1-12]WNZ27670.1 hypothetical protein HJG54_33010 [Leptolyngbya sp. NK1-12]
MTPQPPANPLNSDNTSSDFSQGSYYEVSIPLAQSTDQELLAHYRLWVPANVVSLRGLIVKQHGCGDPAKVTGLDHANDLQWQALAAKHQFALLGTQLPAVYPMCVDEAAEDRVAEQSYLDALSALAEKSHRPELDQIPWALWGHSGGADWAMQMLHHYPERVVAVVNVRCGGILLSSGTSEILNLNPESVPEMLDVPVLWTIGEREPHVQQCVTLPGQIFSKFRKAGAIWAIAVEANAGHESGDTRFLAIPYLDAILAARLTDRTPLQPIDAAQGWLGNPSTHDVTLAEQYQGNALEAAWLPDEKTARVWQQYITGNTWAQLRNGFCRVGEKFSVLRLMQYSAESCYSSKITPTRKPDAPTHVRVTRLGEEVVLTWRFLPDLENGLPAFRIYRGSALLKTIQGQGYNFGDAPVPPDVVLEFRDQIIKEGAIYTVSAVNTLGESVSQPMQLSEQ